METNYHTTGFLKDSSYSSDLTKLLGDYKDKFPGAESLVLNLNEVLTGTKPSKESRVFSEDGKKIEINIDEWKGRDKKGQFTVLPSERSVYKTIIFVLNKAVEEYAEKFPPKEEE